MVKMFSGGPGGGASIDGSEPVACNLEVHQEWIDVSSGLPTRKPDPSWELVDKKGHFHAFTEDGKLPTLAEEAVRKPCPGGCGDPGCEGATEIRYRCRICRKRVRPQWVSSYDSLGRQMPGPKSWSVTVSNAPPPRTAPGEMVSVKVTANGRTYFGVGYTYDLAIQAATSGTTASYTVHGEGELGRRPAPVVPYQCAEPTEDCTCPTCLN